MTLNSNASSKSANQQETVQVKIPSVCCKCGKQAGTIPLKLSSIQAHAYHFVVATVVTQTTRTLTVSVGVGA